MEQMPLRDSDVSIVEFILLTGLELMVESKAIIALMTCNFTFITVLYAVVDCLRMEWVQTFKLMAE